MKKLVLILALVLSVSFLYGCTQSTTPAPTATVPSATAAGYAQTGAAMVEGIGGSMMGWASSGTVGGLSSSGAGITAKAITVTPNDPSAGWFHITGTESSLYGTYEANMYVKLTTASGVTTAIDLYGTYKYSYTYGGYASTYTQTYGSASDPYHGAATYTGTTLTGVSMNGTITSDISGTVPSEGEGGTPLTYVCAFTFTVPSYSLPITTGNDYPTGSISMAWTYAYNGGAAVTEPTITVTYNGTGTVTWAYGSDTGTYTILPASL
jgi:hypothetical protein